MYKNLVCSLRLVAKYNDQDIVLQGEGGGREVRDKENGRSHGRGPAKQYSLHSKNSNSGKNCDPCNPRTVHTVMNIELSSSIDIHFTL
jgi:hypothetical protein